MRVDRDGQMWDLLDLDDGGDIDVWDKGNYFGASGIKNCWRLGDNIFNNTKTGKTPKWPTLKVRYWKDQAKFNSSQYTPEDLIRIKKA